MCVCFCRVSVRVCVRYSIQYDDIGLIRDVPKCLANWQNQIRHCSGVILTWVLNSLIDTEKTVMNSFCWQINSNNTILAVSLW